LAGLDRCSDNSALRRRADRESAVDPPFSS